MTKRIISGVIILLLGFALGAGSLFYISKRYPLSGQYYTPRISKQIEENTRAFSEVVSAVSPSVVNISTVKVIRDADVSEDPFFEFFNDFFGQFYESPRRWKEQSMGSGVIVSEDGYIITNNHVVSDAEQIDVTLYNKKTLKGKIVGSDPKTDIAVVKIDGSGLPVLPWGDSDSLKVGEFVLAIGNPFGLNHTVTMGIISAVGRADVGIAEYEDFIQTDAAINPGNSGGPLVNTEGKLIGINTAIFSKSGGYQGIGFAVPSNMARQLIEELIKRGRIVRGWLGVTIQELTPELAAVFGYENESGALVDEVVAESPAQRAGLRRGDIITAYDGKTVSSPSVLKNLVARSRPGAQVEIKFFRAGRTLSARAVVAESPREPSIIRQSAPTPERQNAFAGISVIDLTEDVAKQLGLSVQERGVVVVRIKAGSPAEEAGLKRGDVIHEINGRQLQSVADYDRILSRLLSADGSQTALLYISRGTRKFYMTISVS